MTRLLLTGLATTTAALALSGCSWLGYGQSGTYANDGYYGGHYQAPVQKQPCCNETLSKWNIEGGVGPSFIVGGDAVTGDRINPSAGTSIRNIEMKDAYEDGWRYEAGLSKALTPNRKLSLMGHYVEHDSKGVVNWGTVNGDPLSGGLSDYKAYGAELGLRQYGRIAPMPLVRSVRPYIEGRVGASYVEDIALQNATITPNADVPFYDGGIVPTAAGLVGVETPFIGRSTIGLETGIRYTHTPDTDTSVLAPGNPIAGTNNGGEKWSVPLMLRGRYRF